ncbi:MAG: aminopeptidase P family N-terminal domain-containing protein, partial [Elusimicrobiaceae bacterium]|nr:aminopeptidase P family N-terminal domain-containing protein [Elusimicrobiaceae bacterium]
MSMQERLLQKIEDLKALWKQDGLDGLVITDNIDQFYILDFFFYPAEAVLLLNETEIICFARQLYEET